MLSTKTTQKHLLRRAMRYFSTESASSSEAEEMFPKMNPLTKQMPNFLQNVSHYEDTLQDTLS